MKEREKVREREREREREWVCHHTLEEVLEGKTGYTICMHVSCHMFQIVFMPMYVGVSSWYIYCNFTRTFSHAHIVTVNSKGTKQVDIQGIYGKSNLFTVW